MIKLPRLLILLALMSLVTACSTTQVQEQWHLPGYVPPSTQKVLVVAMARNESVRKLVESSFTQRLEEKGLTAIPSHQWVADGTKLTREALAPLIQQNGITTVLVTSVRDIQKSKVYQPEAVNPQDDSLFRNVDAYYAYSTSGQHEAGTYVTLTDYLIETNLFDARNHKLSWSIITRTSDAASRKKAVDEVAKIVVKQADKDKAL